MLETLIQQSPLSGTELEIAYRHEWTLDHGSEDYSYWLVTRKSDGARFWLKAAADAAHRKQLADESRLLNRLHCPGVAQVAEVGADGAVPYVAFRYQGEKYCGHDELAQLTPLELLGFGLAITSTVQWLETSKPPVALRSFADVPLLISTMLKRPLLLGLGRYVQTASEETHRQARGSAWQLVADALTAAPEAFPASLLEQGRKWAMQGTSAFAALHQVFNATAFELTTHDL